VPLGQPDHAREFPYDQGLIFQDGRPLIYDSGDYPEMMRRIKELIGWDDFASFRARLADGRRVGIGLPCYVEGIGVGRTSGHVEVDSSGGARVDRPDLAGAGHQTVFRADRRVRARRADRTT